MTAVYTNSFKTLNPVCGPCPKDEFHTGLGFVQKVGVDVFLHRINEASKTEFFVFFLFVFWAFLVGSWARLGLGSGLAWAQAWLEDVFTTESGTTK